MNKKYKITGETKKFNENDNSVYGNAIAYGDSKVYGNAKFHAIKAYDRKVYGDSKVYGNALFEYQKNLIIKEFLK